MVSIKFKQICIFILLSTVNINTYATNIPNPVLSPGDTIVVSLKVLCTPGYTKTLSAVSKSISNKVYTAYGMPKGNYTGYCSGQFGCRLDHIISKELGGSNSPRNLFPMPYTGNCNSRDKDALENKLHRLVCAKSITLDVAQTAIRYDWRVAYKNYINIKGCGE